MTVKEKDAGTSADADTTKTEEKETKSDKGTEEDSKNTKTTDNKQTQADDDYENSDDWISKLDISDNQKKYLKKTLTQNKTRKEKIEELTVKLTEKEQKEAEEQRKRDEEQGNWKKIAEEAEEKLKAKDLKLIRSEVRAYAIKEGIIDPSIIDLLPLDGVSLNADGDVVGADKFVTKYKKDKSYLFGEAKTKEPEGTTNGKTTPPPNTTVVEKDALKMTDEEFKEAEEKMLKKKR